MLRLDNMWVVTNTMNFDVLLIITAWKLHVTDSHDFLSETNKKALYSCENPRLRGSSDWADIMMLQRDGIRAIKRQRAVSYFSNWQILLDFLNSLKFVKNLLSGRLGVAFQWNNTINNYRLLVSGYKIECLWSVKFLLCHKITKVIAYETWNTSTSSAHSGIKQIKCCNDDVL